MIPDTCANCEFAMLKSDDASTLVPADCAWGPRWETVEDARTHRCGQFRMLREPRFVLPDAPQEGFAPDGATEAQEGAELPPGGAAGGEGGASDDD